MKHEQKSKLVFDLNFKIKICNILQKIIRYILERSQTNFVYNQKLLKIGVRSNTNVFKNYSRREKNKEDLQKLTGLQRNKEVDKLYLYRYYLTKYFYFVL